MPHRNPKIRSIDRWTIDYGEGRPTEEIRLPHAWAQELPVSSEGPVVYRTEVAVPREGGRLVFYGVSYEAKVSLDGDLACVHHGIWDAFEVSLDGHRGKTVAVEVQVIKNGGKTFPVNEVASGFLPFVFHTFGGIYKPVEFIPNGVETLDQAPVKPRARVDGTRIFVDDQPFYVRGLLHWGWYPDEGHANPPEDIIREEVREAKELGFNLVKFCLWVPPHQYLEILREEGMEAWIELPLWDPSSDAARQEAIAQEIERIVRQYRHHDNVIVWTVGCELSTSTPAEYRRRLTAIVQNLTGCPLVKDNSGGAEMYGGDLREFGTFYDFHPYCDTPFYPMVLDTLLPGPRREMPTLLGEFNDIDVHRDIARIGDALPYWASTLPELNDQGVRWQHDLPRFLNDSRFALHPTANGHKALMESSRKKALFIRKTVHEAVRARGAIGGYTITGWRDTPISSAGFFDDWDEPRFSPDECLLWNGPDCLFLIPARRPPWVDGGNRPGYRDPLNQFTGQVFFRIGCASEQGIRSGLVWRVLNADGAVVASGAEPMTECKPLGSIEVGEISWRCETPGSYRLVVDFGPAKNEWPIFVVSREPLAFQAEDPLGVLKTGKEPTEGPLVSVGWNPDAKIIFLVDEGTLPAPFWREAAYEFGNLEFWDAVPFAEQWSRWLAISPDRVLDLAVLQATTEEDCEVLMNRIDVRTYVEAPVIVRMGGRIITTIRPWGGLGAQPTDLAHNPAGVAFLRSLLKLVQ